MPSNSPTLSFTLAAKCMLWLTFSVNVGVTAFKKKASYHQDNDYLFTSTIHFVRKLAMDIGMMGRHSSAGQCERPDAGTLNSWKMIGEGKPLALTFVCTFAPMHTPACAGCC